MTSIFNPIKHLLKHFIVLVTALTSFTVIGCNSHSDESTGDEKTAEVTSYEDGTYCADVGYYNPNTGIKNTYKLNVEVENNELTKIYWPNGGWLDETHFDSPAIEDDGSCSFTSDRGNQYSVAITGSKCSFSDLSTEGEESDEKNGSKLTFEECASSINMTDKELLEYEKNFHLSGRQIITEKLCDQLHTLILKRRELEDKRKLLEEQMNKGHIIATYSLGGDDNVKCQMILVQRRDYYYLLEVQGPKKVHIGVTDFDPFTTEWQSVKVTENPSSSSFQIFNIRVVDADSDKMSLEKKMDNYCTY